MICTKCQGTSLVRDTRDLSFGTSSGAGTTIHALTGDYCTSCGEVHVDVHSALVVAAEKTWPGRRAPSWITG